MKIIDCPIIGPRAISEFTISGVLEPEPADLGATTPGAWVFERRSVPGERTEWWYHNPTQLWFRVRRHTGSDEITNVEVARG